MTATSDSGVKKCNRDPVAESITEFFKTGWISLVDRDRSLFPLGLVFCQSGGAQDRDNIKQMLDITYCSNAWIDLWSAFTFLTDDIVSEKSSGAAIAFYSMGAKQCTGRWIWSDPENGHAKPIPGTPRRYLRKEVMESGEPA